jgi:hypothetical protein
MPIKCGIVPVMPYELNCSILVRRTDFLCGNHTDLINAIKTKLGPLGNEVLFIPVRRPMDSLEKNVKQIPLLGMEPKTFYCR